MYAEERQQAIAELVARRGRRRVTALAAEFDVTTETVRRDLSALERLGAVAPGARRRGPARPSPARGPAWPSATRSTPRRRTASPRPR